MRAGLLSAGLAAIVIGGGAAQAGYSVTTLTDPNAGGLTVASGINDTGEVVGYYKDSSNATVFHGFSYVNGAFTTLDFGLERHVGQFDVCERGEYRAWRGGNRRRLQ